MKEYNHPSAYEVFVSLNRSMHKDHVNRGDLRRMMEGEWMMTEKQYLQLLDAIERGVPVIVTGVYWQRTLASYEATDICQFRRKGSYERTTHAPTDRGVTFQLREAIRMSVDPRKRKMNQRGYQITELS